MFIEPMMAASMPLKKRESVTYENGYHLEAKHDGMRAIISKIDGEVEIYSRVGKKYAAHLPKLVKSVKENFPDNTILDGELMVHKGWLVKGLRNIPVPDFNQTMRIMGSNPDKAIARQEESYVTFYCFDIIRLNGDDMTAKTYIERAAVLQTFSEDNSLDFIDFAPLWGKWDQTDLVWLLAHDIEGAILKHESSLYLPGKRRANTWYKVKTELTADVVVMGYTEAKEGKTGKWLGKVGAIRFGAYNDDGVLIEVGQCSGMTDAERDAWTVRRDEGTIGQVIEVKYNDLVGTAEFGTPRHPQYKGIRIDKAPHQCTLDQFARP